MDHVQTCYFRTVRWRSGDDATAARRRQAHGNEIARLDTTHYSTASIAFDSKILLGELTTHAYGRHGPSVSAVGEDLRQWR